VDPIRPSAPAELFRLVVQNIRDYAIFMLDPQGNIQTWNPGAEIINGYTADEIIGKHFSIFYPPESSAKPRLELDWAAEHGRFEEEGWRVRKDGRRYWASVVINALRDEADKPVGFAKVVRDLTERKKMSEELRLSEERFRLIVSQVRDYAVFMLTPEGRIATWNEGAQRIKGYRADEIIGQHFSRFYPDEDLATGKPAMELKVASEVGRFEDEGWRVRKDGSRFWANVIITALRDETGKLVGFAKVTRDLTERKSREELRVQTLQAEEERRRALEANRMKSAFLAQMSHELRSPLNSILGFTEIVADEKAGPLNDEQKDMLGEVITHGRDLLRLINNILDLSKIEAGRMPMTAEAFDLEKLIGEVKSSFEIPAEQKGVALTVSVDPACREVTLDRHFVWRIMMNLVSNALKIRAVRRDVDFRLSVRDTGLGIRAEDIPQLFKEFHQVGAENRAKGTGLGLALVKRYVERMGGSVSAESEPGKGSIFTVTLPLRLEAQ
jgi:PAS domain S-box-containing protein